MYVIIAITRATRLLISIKAQQNAAIVCAAFVYCSLCTAL